MNRRELIKGSLVSAMALALPADGQAQGLHYTIDTYPYRADPVTIPQFGIWRDVAMDVSLLHPETGAPTIGFYAALDRYHGEPFGEAWTNTYRKYIGDRSVHDPDRGAMIQIVNHIRTHAVTADQFSQAYHIAKAAWDQNASLRLAHVERFNADYPQFG